MTTLFPAAGLTAIYLLVLTSLKPGDVLIGAGLALGVAFVVRRRTPRPRPPLAGAAIAGLEVVARTAVETARGSWRVLRFCLRGDAHLGLVEIPRNSRSSREVALWGVATTEAPDEIVVDVDEERAVMIVHLVDASDADAVRARHERNHDRWRRRIGG